MAVTISDSWGMASSGSASLRISSSGPAYVSSAPASSRPTRCCGTNSSGGPVM